MAIKTPEATRAMKEILSDEPKAKEQLFVIIPIECAFEEIQQSLQSKGQALTLKEIMQMNHACLGEILKDNFTLNEKVYQCTKDLF